MSIPAEKKAAYYLLYLGCRVTFLAILMLSIGVQHIAFAGYSNGIPVLLYHHVNENRTELPLVTVTPREFERQMAMLKSAGFQTISPQQLLAYMRQEPVELPDKPILITFDDGYEDNYVNAFPTLKRYGFSAVVFMVGINLDRDERLSSSQVKEMSDYGIYFGGHSMNHHNLTKMAGQELYHEVKDVRRTIGSVIKKSVDCFSYPYGFYNLRVWEAVENAGYQAAFTVLPGINKPARDNVYLLRRIPIYHNTDFDALFQLLDKNQPKTKLLQYSPEQ